MCWVKTFSSYTHALPTKGRLLSTPNHNSSLYTLTHPMQQKDIAYSEINNTPALVVRHRAITFLTVPSWEESQVDNFHALYKVYALDVQYKIV